MNVAIIVAGGQGTRLGGTRPKQFLEIAGAPILIHTVRRFDQCPDIQEVILVLPAQESHVFLGLAEKHGVHGKLVRVVQGGASRSESVLKGLRTVREASAEVVVVHDGVRPLVTPSEISRTISAAQAHGAAILAAPVLDTIKEIKDHRVAGTLKRATLCRALTPQAFRYDVLRRAYEHVPGLTHTAAEEITDDSSLVERLGIQVAIVEGSSRNIKITGPEDLEIAEVLFRNLVKV